MFGWLRRKPKRPRTNTGRTEYLPTTPATRVVPSTPLGRRPAHAPSRTAPRRFDDHDSGEVFVAPGGSWMSMSTGPADLISDAPEPARSEPACDPGPSFGGGSSSWDSTPATSSSYDNGGTSSSGSGYSDSGSSYSSSSDSGSSSSSSSSSGCD